MKNTTSKKWTCKWMDATRNDGNLLMLFFVTSVRIVPAHLDAEDNIAFHEFWVAKIKDIRARENGDVRSPPR